jgi:NAD-dependent dihydropyrimidine dehydrogenase PreA subunit/putative sterol carrier protein
VIFCAQKHVNTSYAMTDIAKHPTVLKILNSGTPARPPRAAEAGWLRQLALEAGADDVGFVAIDRAELSDQRAEILKVLPQTRTLVSFVRRMNRTNIRTPLRSLSNLEFHHTGEEIDDIGRAIAAACEARGLRAVNVTMGFPMEAERWPGKMWVVSHKPVAVAAGLGQMGIHRNVIHPRFGNFILLGTVLLDVEVGEDSKPIDYNPCLSCKLCVAACPTGAIAPDGYFDFSACYTHNYREFMGGFGDWVENLVASNSVKEYRTRVSDAETVSMWQSLSFGANYKAAYCLAVCPAGEEVIAPFLNHRKDFLDEVVRPLQEKVETIYVVPESDAESYVQRRFPHKKIKRVGSGLRIRSIQAFLQGMKRNFQRGRAEGLNAVNHFTFKGVEEQKVTVIIRDKKLGVEAGHIGKADFRLTADSETWLGFVAKEKNLLWALLRRKIRVWGNPKLLLAFGRCFPS